MSAIQQRLAAREDGTVDLKLFKSCKNLVRTLPALCYSKSQPDDVDTEPQDHCHDVLRYGFNTSQDRVSQRASRDALLKGSGNERPRPMLSALLRHTGSRLNA